MPECQSNASEQESPARTPQPSNGPSSRLDRAAPAGGPVVWEHHFTHPVAGPIPRGDGTVDEVWLTGTFNAPPDEAARASLLAEAFRVLKPGGKVVTHGLLADGPLPGAQPKLPGLAALVSHVPARTEVEAALRAAGFVQIQAVKLTEKPRVVHDGVGLREVKFAAHRPFADDGETRQVLYKGPFAEATADGGRTFPRGERVRVPAALWQQLRLGAGAEQFLFFEPGESPACGS